MLGRGICAAGGQAPSLLHIRVLHADYGSHRIAIGGDRGAAQHAGASAGTHPGGSGAGFARRGGDANVAAEANVETRPEQVDDWTQTVIKAAEPLLSSKVDSWRTGVNRNVAGRTVRRVLGYNGNGVHFRRKTDEVAKGGYKEFAFR
jgi:hypothetical protein